MVDKARALPSSRIVAKHVREVRDWCIDPFNAQSLRDKTAAEIHELSHSGDSNRAAGMAARLGQRSLWFAQTGLDKVLGGEPVGWQDIEQCRLYKYWAVRILARAYDLDSREPKQWRISIQHAALALAHALAVQDDAAAAWLANRMDRARSDGAFGTSTTWSTWPFVEFVLALFGIQSGGATTAEAVMPDVYPPLLRAISESDEVFKDAFLSASEYHVVESVQRRGYQPYVETPYHLLPVELVAALNARRRVFGRVPKFEHPLFSVASAPNDGTALRRSSISDPLLELVTRVAIEDLPGL